MQKKKKTNIILALLIIILLLLILWISINIFIKIDKNEQPEKKYNHECNCDLKIAKYDNFVYLGDSITDWYPLDEMYSEEIPIVNSGVAGYETTDILKRMDKMVYQYNPTKVFILIGTNDLKYKDDSEEKVADNIIKIIKKINKKRPNAKIYYQSIYPVNRNLKNHAAEERYNDEIKKVNSILKDYCKKNNVTYIDMHKILSDENGNLNEKYTTDGLHLSTSGYIQVTLELMSYMR